MKLLVILALVLGAANSHAIVLAHYGFNGNTDADNVAGGIVASSATIPAGGSSGLFPIEGSQSRFIFNSDLTNTPTPGAADIEMTFSLTPPAGQAIALDATDSVTWKFLSYDNDVGNMHTFTRMYIASDAAFTNVLAVSAVFDSDHEASLGGGNPSDPRWGPIVTGNLDQALVSSGTLYFGLAAGDNSTFGDKQLRFDDVTVNGIIVPEPATILLAALGGLALIHRRR